jgi:hypothetical protein
MFVAALPIAPLMAIVNNVVATPSIAYKQLKVLRRSPPQRAQDIGIWFQVLKITSVIAVSSNVSELFW